MGNIRREMETIRKNEMEMLGKNHFKRDEGCLQCLLESSVESIESWEESVYLKID